MRERIRKEKIQISHDDIETEIATPGAYLMQEENYDEICHVLVEDLRELGSISVRIPDVAYTWRSGVKIEDGIVSSDMPFVWMEMIGE